MTQKDFNDKTLDALTQIAETLTDMGKTRDAMYQLIQLESMRVDSAEDKLDILMGERCSRIVNEDAKVDDTDGIFDLLMAHDKSANIDSLIESLKKLR